MKPPGLYRPAVSTWVALHSVDPARCVGREEDCERGLTWIVMPRRQALSSAAALTVLSRLSAPRSDQRFRPLG